MPICYAPRIYINTILNIKIAREGRSPIGNDDWPWNAAFHPPRAAIGPSLRMDIRYAEGQTDQRIQSYALAQARARRRPHLSRGAPLELKLRIDKHPRDNIRSRLMVRQRHRPQRPSDVDMSFDMSSLGTPRIDVCRSCEHATVCKVEAYAVASGSLSI